MSITQAPSITRHSMPSLACFVAHPFGLTLGPVGDTGTHDAVLRAVLGSAEADHAPGTIVPTGFRWPDDLRARQLTKRAH